MSHGGDVLRHGLDVAIHMSNVVTHLHHGVIHGAQGIRHLIHVPVYRNCQGSNGQTQVVHIS